MGVTNKNPEIHSEGVTPTATHWKHRPDTGPHSKRKQGGHTKWPQRELENEKGEMHTKRGIQNRKQSLHDRPISQKIRSMDHSK